MVTTPCNSGTAGSSRGWLLFFSREEIYFFSSFSLILWLRSKQYCSRFNQMFYLQQLDNYFKFMSNVGQTLFAFFLSPGVEQTLEVFMRTFLFRSFLSIPRLKREILLINSALKKNREAAMSDLILPSIVCHWTTQHTWIIHSRVLASVKIGNHQPSKKSQLVVVVLPSQETLNLEN